MESPLIDFPFYLSPSSFPLIPLPSSLILTFTNLISQPRRYDRFFQYHRLEHFEQPRNKLDWIVCDRFGFGIGYDGNDDQ